MINLFLAALGTLWALCIVRGLSRRGEYMSTTFVALLWLAFAVDLLNI